MKVKFYISLGVFFVLGMLASSAYRFETKYHVANRFLVRTYLSSEQGHQNVRELLHDDCYFTAQYLKLVKNKDIDMFEMDHDYCWKSADKTMSLMLGDK